MSVDILTLVEAAKAGRVAHTGFLEPEDSAVLATKLRQRQVSVHVWGGYGGARRRVVTAFSNHMPEASTRLSALYVAGVHDPTALRSSLQEHYQADELGDVVTHVDGLSVVVLKDKIKEVSINQEGKFYVVQEMPLEKVVVGQHKRLFVIVPSLRVDALGAKAFKVSRSYFAKGIAAGNVKVNGKKTSKSSQAEPGDEIYAEGLGRFYVVEVKGETRKGNLKVVLETEQAKK